LRPVHRRFNWNNGSNCGRRSLNGYYALSLSDWYIGWRVIPVSLSWEPHPHRLVKIYPYCLACESQKRGSQRIQGKKQ
jgi:hypothetical protein